MSRAAEEFDVIREKASDTHLAFLTWQDHEEFRSLLLGVAVDFFGHAETGSLRDVLLYYEEASENQGKKRASKSQGRREEKREEKSGGGKGHEAEDEGDVTAFET